MNHIFMVQNILSVMHEAERQWEGRLTFNIELLDLILCIGL